MPEEPQEPDPPPTEAWLAEKENGPLMARWAPDTRVILMKEFIREHQLFAQFNIFLKKRVR